MKPFTTQNGRSTPTTASSPGVFKSSSATIYRSLEVPLPSSINLPLSFPSNLSSKPGFLSPLSSSQVKNGGGEVKWETSTDGPPCPGLFTLSSNCIQLPNGRPKVGEVDAALDKHEIEVTNRTPFEWFCTQWTNFVETSFVVRLFNTNVLDFQRECGCPFQFNSIVATVSEELKGENCKEEEKKEF